MPVPIIRYQLDPTGENPNNLVLNEVHKLDDFQVRVLVPDYGPFYKETITLYDLATNRLLDKDVDYKTLHLLQDPSITFGKEICEVILITNSTVSSQVSISYQNLGGNYQNSSKAIADTLQTLLKDARPVDWVNGIFNKPFQYTPAPHPHLFEDVVGTGPLLVAMDRLCQAITLSNVPAFEALVDWVRQFQKSWVSEQEILDMASVEKAVSLERLLFATQRLNFNAITFRSKSTTMRLGGSMRFTISCTNLFEGENLFWTIQHENSTKGSKDSMFGSTSGIVTPINQDGSFLINTLRSGQKFGDYRFRVLLRRNTIAGPVLAKSATIKLIYEDPAVNSDLALVNGRWDHVCCVLEPGIVLTPEAAFLARNSFTNQVLAFQ